VLEVLVPPSSQQEKPRLSAGGIWQPPIGRPSPSGPSLVEVFPLPLDPPPGAADWAPLSWRIECSLGGQADLARRTREARDLADRAKRRLEKARNLVRGLEARLAASLEVDRVREDGELLKANLVSLRRGMERVEVEDFFAPGSPPRRIELDPRLSPQENFERLFERARKLERSRAAVEGEIVIARLRERDLASLVERTQDPASDLTELEQRAVESGLLEKRQDASSSARSAPSRSRKDAAPRVPYRTFEASRGGQIRVGRSARDNDELTFRHAKGSDLWLHTADAPGSHVVLVLSKGADPDSEELIDAAHLAVHFSPLRASARARVHVARRKEVHKPRGAKPGLVQLSGGRILDVRMQPERLRRLLGGRRPPTGGPAGGLETAPETL
jgi:predicted ribosome quality control (RQC) complex YloA/Tae2 family protein